MTLAVKVALYPDTTNQPNPFTIPQCKSERPGDVLLIPI